MTEEDSNYSIRLEKDAKEASHKVQAGLKLTKLGVSRQNAVYQVLRFRGLVIHH